MEHSENWSKEAGLNAHKKWQEANNEQEASVGNHLWEASYPEKSCRSQFSNLALVQSTYRLLKWLDSLSYLSEGAQVVAKQTSDSPQSSDLGSRWGVSHLSSPVFKLAS